MNRRNGLRPVVVGVDGSERARRAVRWGAAEAARRSMLLRLVAERAVVRGQAASELTPRSATAQLVVVGSRGPGRFAGLLLGPVGNALVHRAECSVAVVRTAEGGDHDAP